jgi:nickel-dependent lactate racemase
MWKDVRVDRWERQMEIQVPSSATVIESEAKGGQASDPLGKLTYALTNPMGMERIRATVNKGSRVAIAFDDPTKLSPNALALPLVLDELNEAGVRQENIILIGACGTHRKWTPSEYVEYRNVGYGLPPGKGIAKIPKEVLNDFWPHRFIQHDGARTDNFVNMGYSRLGDLVECNKVLVDYDLLIYIGGVQPMKWGGYGGTGVVVGLASARSIASHHTVRVIGHKESCHADPRTHLYRAHKDAVMERIEEYIGRKVFYIEGMVNGAMEWMHFSAGHFKEIQEPAWRAGDQDRLYPAEQADVIIAGLPKWCAPYDTSRNPLVCLSAASTILRMSIGKPVLREGGVIILIGLCDGSIDTDALPSYPEVIDLFGKTGNASRLEEKYLDEYLFFKEDYLKRHMAGMANHPVHPFWLFAETQYVHDHVGKLIIATAENPGAVRKVGGTWAQDFSEAWRMAERIVGKNPKTIVLPTYFTKLPVKFMVK